MMYRMLTALAVAPSVGAIKLSSPIEMDNEQANKLINADQSHETTRGILNTTMREAEKSMAAALEALKALIHSPEINEAFDILTGAGTDKDKPNLLNATVAVQDELSNLGSAVQDTANARDGSKTAVENLRNAAKVLKLDIQAGSPSRQELIELSNAIDAVLSNFTASDKAVSKLQPAVDRTNTKVKKLLNSSEIADGMKIVRLRALWNCNAGTPLLPLQAVGCVLGIK